MFNIYLGIYIIGAIFVLIYGPFKLFNKFGFISSIIFFIGALAIISTFGLKWFSQKGSIFSKTPVSWPPMINTCPDYLVYYKRVMPDGSAQDSCIDTIGVSKNGALKRFPTIQQPSDVPTAEDYYFSLITQSTDTTIKNQELCQRCLTYGLTWEGICNGESCVSPDGPVAPGGGGSGTSGCPVY